MQQITGTLRATLTLASYKVKNHVEHVPFRDLKAAQLAKEDPAKSTLFDAEKHVHFVQNPQNFYSPLPLQLDDQVNAFFKPEHPIEGVRTIYKPLRRPWRLEHEITKAGRDVPTSPSTDEVTVAEALLALDCGRHIENPSTLLLRRKREKVKRPSARATKSRRRD